MLRTSPIAKIALLVFSLSFATLAQNPSTLKESAKAAHMRQLNNQILNLHAQMQSAQSESSRKQLRGQAFQALKTRQAALVALMKENPKAALTFAFSQEALDELSTKFPESDAFLEEHVKTMGEVEHWIADYPKGKAESLYFLSSGEQSVSLHFAGPEPDLRHGDVLDITGVMSGSDMVVETSTVVPDSASANATPLSPHERTSIVVLGGVFVPFIGGIGLLRRYREIARLLVVLGLVPLLILSTSTLSYAQASCSTTGVQNTAILLVNFADIATSVDGATAYTDFFDTSTGRSLNGYWQEASYGQTTAAGNVFGPFTVGASSSYTCSTIFNQFAQDVLAAATAGGVNLQNYSRIFVVMPNLSCGWAGLTLMGSAGAGCSTLSTPSGNITASLSYLVDTYLSFPQYPYSAARDSAVALAAHEGGHQIGLAHSGTITAQPTAVLEAPGTAGQITDGGDLFAVMGSNNLGLYKAQQRVQILGWISNPTNYQTVTSSGTYTVQPIETNPASGAQVLRIQRGANPGYYLWLEYKQPIGLYDSTLANAPYTAAQPYTGAMITYEDPYYEGNGQLNGHTYLADFNPNDTYYFTPNLNPGQTWTDLYTNLSLSVVSANSSGLTVNVSYGSIPCTHTNPTIVASPGDPSIYPGSSASYAITVTNNDSSGCSSNTFALSSNLPSNWPTTFSSTSLSLAPGQSGSVTMYKTGPSGTPPGTYAVNASASSNSAVGTGTANVTVMSTPSLSTAVSVSSSTYSRKSTVPITATAWYGGSPVSGASVTFTMVLPSGGAVQQSATTGSKGTATWSYKLNQRSQTGTYSVSAQVSYSPNPGAASTQTVSNTATFSVH